MKPRNTLVSVVEIKEEEKKLDSGLVVPATNREYKLCEVVDVGPGMVTDEGELSLTRDLRPGQTVIVQLHITRQMSRDLARLEPLGIDFKSEDGRDLKLVEQSQIVAIVREPGESKLALAD